MATPLAARNGLRYAATYTWVWSVDPPGRRGRERQRDQRILGVVAAALEPAVVGRGVVGHEDRVEPGGLDRGRHLGDRVAGDELVRDTATWSTGRPTE